MGEGTSSPPPRSSNSDAASAAIHGLGGVGKSVLAQEYGWRNRERYRGVWWLRAEQPETLLDDLIALGSRLMPGLEEIPEKDRAVHLALDAITQTATDKPWLFIYDNAESPAALDKLTPAGGAHLIVTSRWSDWYGHAEALPVDVFPPEVAADYLMERTRHPDRAAAKRLAEALGYLPLALSHARATCWASNLDFDSYRERMSEQLRKAPRGADYPQSVYATFDLAIRKAASLCPQAELLMAIAAFFAPDRIPVSLFTEDTMSESERDDALATLAELSLITHETLEDGAPAFTMHRLVQAVMRDRLGDHTGEATLQALKLVLATLPKGNAAGEHTEWSRIERVLPHALSILRYAPDDGEHIDDTISLCVSAAAYFRSRAAYKESQLLIERELAISAKALGPNHLNVGQSLNNLAVIYREQGKYDQAEPLYKRAFAILEEALGPDHPETGMSAGNLAGLLETQGRYDDAEQFRLRALEIHENTLGPDHPNVGIHLNNLALLYDAQGRYEEAEPLFERALTITEKALGPDHPNVGNRLNNLAGLYCTQGRYEAAEPFYMRSIAIREKALGPDHPDVGKSMNGLALLYDAQGRYEEAEPLFERALTITEKALGPDHPDVGNRLNNLAGLYQAQGRHEAAEPLLERALAIDEKALGPDHPSTGIDLNNLAALYRKQGRHEAAAPLCQRALAIFEKSLGPDHPNTQRVKANYEVLKSEMATQAGEA